MRIAILLLLMSLTYNLQAADRKGQYAVWGPGQKSCHAYTQAREADDYDQYKYFVMGYLTAYNTLTDKTYRISGNKNFDQVLEWLDNYCGPKGVHSFEQAVTSFIVDSHKSRLTRPGSRFQR